MCVCVCVCARARVTNRKAPSRRWSCCFFFNCRVSLTRIFTLSAFVVPVCHVHRVSARAHCWFLSFWVRSSLDAVCVLMIRPFELCLLWCTVMLTGTVCGGGFRQALRRTAVAEVSTPVSPGIWHLKPKLQSSPLAMCSGKVGVQSEVIHSVCIDCGATACRQCTAGAAARLFVCLFLSPSLSISHQTECHSAACGQPLQNECTQSDTKHEHIARSTQTNTTTGAHT